MLLDPSDALSSVASYRIAELGFEELRADVAETQHREAGPFTELSTQALGAFRGRRAEVNGAE
jgi:hypothetical protein